MITFNKKYLEYNPIDERWKVIDNEGFPFGDGATPEEAIASARIVTDETIYFGNTIFAKATNTEVRFKVISSIDNAIYEEGILQTSEADDERPIKWFDYGLKEWFPNNPFDPDFQRGLYNRHYKLRDAVLNDDLLIQFLVDYAEESTQIERPGYTLEINGGFK